jgi:hypothetical protein
MERRRFFHTTLILATAIWPRLASAQSLKARVEGDRLRVGVQKMPFLSGEALRRLRDGVSVNFVFRLLALAGRSGTVIARSEYRFVISYDIFEEKFQVSTVRPAARVQSHLTQEAAEAACLEAMDLPVQSLGTAASFWLRWEYEAEQPVTSDESDATLGTLVDIFSRRSSKQPLRGAVEAGPFRLSDLPRLAPSRGGATP